MERWISTADASTLIPRLSTDGKVEIERTGSVFGTIVTLGTSGAGEHPANEFTQPEDYILAE